MLSPEELLAGSSLTFEVEVPTEILHPTNGAGEEAISHTVRLRPLTVGDLQLVTRAAKENDSLLAALMVQRALVEPEVSVAQVSAMHVGLLQFLLREVNRLSGIETSADDLSAAAEEVASTALAEGSRPLVGRGLLADLVEAGVAERGGERGSSSGRGRGAPQPGERGAPARRAPEPSNGAASPDGTPPSPGEPPARPGRLAAPPSGGLGSPAWTPAEAGARANREWAWPGAPSVATGEEPRGAPAVDAAPSSEPTSRGVEPGGG